MFCNPDARILTVAVLSAVSRLLLSEDSPSPKRHARYHLIAYSGFDLRQNGTPLAWSFVWKGGDIYEIECESNGDKCEMSAQYDGNKISMVKELKKSSCDGKRCFQIKYKSKSRYRCLRIKPHLNRPPLVGRCDPMDANQKWIIEKLPSDEGMQEAYFLIKTTPGELSTLKTVTFSLNTTQVNQGTSPTKANDGVTSTLTLASHDKNNQTSTYTPTTPFVLATHGMSSIVTGASMANPFFTLKQCSAECSEGLGDVFRRCKEENILYLNHGNPILCNPMSEMEQILSKLMNIFGSTWVVVTSMISTILAVVSRPNLLINKIQCLEDILLGSSHILIMLFVFRVDNKLICKSTATSLILLLSLHQMLLLLECICVHVFLTNTVNSTNTKMFKSSSLILVTCSTICIAGYLNYFIDDLQSKFSCWINYNTGPSILVLTVSGILFSLSTIFTESGISGIRKVLPTVNQEERNVCMISVTTLMIKIALNAASVFVTSFAIFSQNFEVFPVSFGINGGLGWYNFFAHAICNHKVMRLLKKIYRCINCV